MGDRAAAHRLSKVQARRDTADDNHISGYNMDTKIVRIGGASGALSDSALSVPQLIAVPGMNYLAFDYLGEAAMGMMGKMLAADPQSGFMREFLDVQIGPFLAEIAAKKIKITANAGGLNPRGLTAMIEAKVRALGLDLKVACVEGDNLAAMVPDLQQEAIRDMFTGAAFPERIISINAYLGAMPVAEALARGADIVITGRVVDSALILGPLIHEFGWSPTDFDRLAAGTAAGHLLECGAQATGGTFTDWRDVPDWANIGFPYAECHADGSFVLTKAEGSGGLVSIGTTAEQLLYEVSDPQTYFVPDVTCDFSGAQLDQIGPDRVRVTGVRGYAPTDSYKVCVTYDDGWRAVALQPIIGVDAAAKARRQADAILERTGTMLHARGLAGWSQTHVDIIGGDPAAGQDGVRSVVCRIVVDHETVRAADIFWREQNSAIMNMSVGTSIGLAIAAPRAMPLIGLFSFLIDKDAVTGTVSLDGVDVTPAAALKGGFDPAMVPAITVPAAVADETAAETMRLVDLAWARSGDKGDLFNVAVIARDPAYLPALRAALTVDVIAACYTQFLRNPAAPKVERFEAPGPNALNFVVHESQCGGINTSPRLDPAAKSMAQYMLNIPVAVPRSLADVILKR